MFKYATWYRDEAGLHTAADLVSVVFERSIDVGGFPGLVCGDEDINPLTASCRAMRGVLSVAPKFFTEESKMSALGGEYNRIARRKMCSSLSDVLLLYVQKCGRRVMSGDQSNARWTPKHAHFLELDYAKFFLASMTRHG